MAKAYVVVTEEIRDPVGLKNYAEKAIGTIRQAGGRVLVSDPAPQVLEGSWHGTKTVILEFDSAEAARGWYESAGYQGVVGLRHAAAESNAVLLHGLEQPRG